MPPPTGRSDGFEYGAAVNYLHSNGISAADSRATAIRETDGTGNLGLTANTRYHVTSALSLDLRGYYTAARTGFDDNYLPPDYRLSDSPVYARNRLLAGYAGINLALFDGRLRNRFAYIGTRSTRTVFDSPYYLPLHEDYAYRGTVRRFEYQGIVDLSDSDQIDLRRGNPAQPVAVEHWPARLPRPGRNRITGYYLQGQTTLLRPAHADRRRALRRRRAIRRPHSVKFAAAWSPNGGDTVLRANYGDGFKAPTLYELFSEYSNPVAALAPETAHGWEAGIDQRF